MNEHVERAKNKLKEASEGIRVHVWVCGGLWVGQGWRMVLGYLL